MKRKIFIYALLLTMLSSGLVGCADNESSQSTKLGAESSYSDTNSQNDNNNEQEEADSEAEADTNSGDDLKSFMDKYASEDGQLQKVSFKKRVNETDLEDWGPEVSEHIVDLIPCGNTFKAMEAQVLLNDYAVDYAILLDNGDIYSCNGSNAILLFKNTGLTSFDGARVLYCQSELQNSYDYMLVTKDKIIVTDTYGKSSDDLPSGEFQEFDVQDSVLLNNTAISENGNFATFENDSSTDKIWNIYALEDNELVHYVVNAKDFSQTKVPVTVDPNVKIKQLYNSSCSDIFCVGEDNALYFMYTSKKKLLKVADNVDTILYCDTMSDRYKIIAKGTDGNVYSYISSDTIQPNNQYEVNSTKMFQFPDCEKYWLTNDYDINFYSINKDQKLYYNAKDIYSDTDEYKATSEEITFNQSDDDLKEIMNFLDMNKAAAGSINRLYVLGKDSCVYQISSI